MQSSYGEELIFLRFQYTADQYLHQHNFAIKMKQNMQKTSSNGLLLNSADIKLLYQIAIKISEHSLSILW